MSRRSSPPKANWSDAMLKIVFVRHGNTFEDGEPSRQVGAETDVPLTDAGRVQAEAVARHLKARGLAVRAIHAGALKRQRETAEILSRGLDAPVVDEPALAELSYGAWENLTTAELKERFPSSYEAWNVSGAWPSEFEGDAESVRRRLQRFLDKIRCSYEDGATVVAVTSQGVLKLLTSVIEPERWEALQAKKAVEELKAKTGAMCEIEFADGAWKTVAWNVRPE